MDLVSDMLFQNLQAAECNVAQLRPSLRSYPFGGNTQRLLHRFFEYPRWLRAHAKRFDLFHIMDHSYAQLVNELPAERTVVTCHDLDTFRCLLVPVKDGRSLPFRLMTKRILGGLMKARHVVCVSETVRNELLSYSLVPPERVSVILNGNDAIFTRLPDPEADGAVERLLNAGAETMLLLHVGSTIRRKRIDTLLHVFARVRESLPNVRLLRVGGPFNDDQSATAAQLGVQDFVQVLPHLDRRTLAAVYRRADLLLLPSEAEGFGLPLVEAMACGCPVVASDIPVLREIGGEGAIYCPVAEVDYWAKAVVKGEWKQRPAAGVENAARFSWRKNAEQYLEIYNSVLGI